MLDLLKLPGFDDHRGKLVRHKDSGLNLNENTPLVPGGKLELQGGRRPSHAGRKFERVADVPKRG